MFINILKKIILIFRILPFFLDLKIFKSKIEKKRKISYLSENSKLKKIKKYTYRGPGVNQY